MNLPPFCSREGTLSPFSQLRTGSEFGHVKKDPSECLGLAAVREHAFAEENARYDPI
jgi:hypothetical protein